MSLSLSISGRLDAISKKRSSKDDSKGNTAAASEAGRTTVDTGGSKKRSSNDEHRGTAAASVAESALVDTVLLETEGGIMMSSSEADIPRGGFAHPEHRRPDGWTSTPCGKDDDEASSQPLVRTGGEGAHDNIKIYWLRQQLRLAGRGATAKTTPTR